MRTEAIERTLRWPEERVTLRKGIATMLAVGILTAGVVSERAGVPKAIATEAVAAASVVIKAAADAVYDVRVFTADRFDEFSGWIRPQPK